jgi:murein L,D-transpeptidase YcbB/YkuD
VLKGVWRGLLLAVACGAALSSPGCGRLRVDRTDAPSPVETALRTELGSSKRPAYVTSDKEGARLWKLTRAFYARRAYAPAWIKNDRPRPQMDALVRALKAANREGLDPELYAASQLEARRQEASRFLSRKGFKPDEAGRFDAWLTSLYMKYASDLADGLSDLAHVDPAWRIQPEKFDPLDHLEQALTHDRVAESLLELTPRAPQYLALRDALAEYRKRAAAGGWPTVRKSLSVKPGQEGPDVVTLARRLAASGDYSGDIPAQGSMKFDAPLLAAVRKFQRRHGLQDNGVVSAAVVRAMNVPIEARIRQIQLNMERWRWLPRDLGARHIVVNIPAYRLEVWENGSVQLAMRVVVGKKDTPTPIFNDTMTHLVFSPYWNVPPEIARNETLPAILTDAAFLDRNNMEVVDESGNPVDPGTIDLADPEKYRFRQRPGRGNSLGLVKFMFPNQFHVYLHDTPVDSLFARATRSFSHGCVRLEEPLALAEYALRDQSEWTSERIQKAMHAREERVVKLRAPLRVYLGYWTTALTPDGVQFLEDVYGIDTRQNAQLAERLARQRARNGFRNSNQIVSSAAH